MGEEKKGRSAMRIMQLPGGKGRASGMQAA